MRTVLRGGNGLLTPSLLTRLTEPVVNRWPATMFARFAGSLAYRDRLGMQTATGTGPVRYQPAPDARINYAINGSFDNPPGGWGFSGGTFAYSSERATHGPTSGKYVVTDASSLNRVFRSFRGPLEAGTYTLAVDIFNANSRDINAKITLQWGYGELGTSATLPAGQWTRVTHTFTAAASTAYGFVNVFLKGTPDFQAGDTFYIDAAIFTQGSDGTFTDDGAVAWLNLATGQLTAAKEGAAVSSAVLWVEESTTNEIPDPIFANSDINAHWGTTGAGVTLTRETSSNFWSYRYLYSDSVARVVTDGSVAEQGLTLLPTVAPAVQAGDVRTAQVAVRRQSGTGDLKLQIVGLDASNVVTETFETTFTPLASSGAHFYPNLPKVTANFASPNTVKYVVRVVTATASAQTFYVGYVGAEQKAYATSPCHGSMGTGYSWSGTAHASTSTRSNAFVSVPNANHLDSSMNGAFSVVMWYTKQFTPSPEIRAWEANSSANWPQGPALRVRSDGKMTIAPKGDGVGGVVTPSTVPVGEEHCYGMTWDGTRWRAYYDGVLIGTTTGAVPSLGLDANMRWWAQGYFRSHLIYRRVLTDAEMAALANLGPRRVGYDTLRMP